ncbi:hypothetical protein Hhis01_00879 [Haloarcula hispanica]
MCAEVQVVLGTFLDLGHVAANGSAPISGEGEFAPVGQFAEQPVGVI